MKSETKVAKKPFKGSSASNGTKNFKNGLGKKPIDKSKPFKKKKFNKKKGKVEKVVVNLKTPEADNWKKVIQQAADEAKRIKEIRNKRRIQKGLPPLDEKKVDVTVDEKSKIWFEVDKIYLPEKETNGQTETTTVTCAKLTKAVAIDCEMVGVGEGGKDSILARVSIVNQYGEVVYDKHVQPTENITDYRTHVSGIRPDDLKKHNAHPFKLVQKEVSEIIEKRVLVGHALHNDLQVLLLSHPKKKLRDTQKCKIFRQKYPSLGGLSSLKNLAKTLLGITIQEGEHNSIQDAQAAMRIYTAFKKEWEKFLKDKKAGKKVDKKEEQQAVVQPIGMGSALDGIQVKGSENHKRYVKNKLKKRLNKNKFLNKK
jgi:RNA exonuclease 4